MIVSCFLYLYRFALEFFISSSAVFAFSAALAFALGGKMPLDAYECAISGCMSCVLQRLFSESR